MLTAGTGRIAKDVQLIVVAAGRLGLPSDGWMTSSETFRWNFPGR